MDDTDTTWVPEGEGQVLTPDGQIEDERLGADEHRHEPPPWEPPPGPEKEQRIRVDIYHHFPEGFPAVSVKLAEDIVGTLNVTVVGVTPPPPATPQTTKAVLNLKGASPMALNVDDTTGDIVLTFEDDKNDVTGPPPGDGSGLVVTFTSDDPAVCALGDAVVSADGQSYSSPATPASEGSFNASAVVANTSGAPLTDADGTTPFEQPGSISVPVSAGQASSGSLAEQG